MVFLMHSCSVMSAKHWADTYEHKGRITFSAMASPTASAACVVAFLLLEKPRQPAEMQDCTRAAGVRQCDDGVVVGAHDGTQCQPAHRHLHLSDAAIKVTVSCQAA